MFAFLGRIVFPGQDTQGRPEAWVTPPHGAELLTLRAADGRRVAALFGPALGPDGSPHPDAPRRPTVLFFYGNAMCLASSLDLFEAFRRLGVNVLIPDYLGYGMSDPGASEAGCYATADACFDHIQARPDVDPGRIVAAGWSLGGAVAVDLAARRPVAGLAVFSSITSAADVARTLVPFLPAAELLLTRHRFASLDKIARVRCPILIGHGERDDIVPFAMMARLADAAGQPVVRLTVPGAGHNDFWLVGGDRLLAAFQNFLESVPPIAASGRDREAR